VTKVRLSRVRGGGALRTDTVEGLTSRWPPEVGRPLVVIAEPLDPEADLRRVVTSQVKEVVLSGEACLVETENSTYAVERLQ